MRELDDREPCPCGRDALYGECCKSVGIRWYREGDLLYKQYNAHIPQEGMDFLNENEQKFLMLFGREPTSDDLIFFDASAHGNDYFRKCITFLRNLGLPKEWIYAFYRTDGLMPTVENEKFLSQSDIELFRWDCHEYTELMDADFGSGRINALLFTSITNEMLESACDNILPSVLSGLEYFLNTVTEKRGGIVNPPNSLKEYASFIAIRVIKALRSVRMLAVSYETESIYSIGRSLFECYVYLKNINDDQVFFDEEILPVLNSHEYGFEVNEGQINYKKMHISKALNSAKRKRGKSLYRLNKQCGPAIDSDLYNYYYQPACQFVHIDAFTARCCFYEEDLYAEFDSSLVATTCVLATAILVLEQLAKLALISELQARDLMHLSSECAYRICDCLMMLAVDPEQSEDEYHQLLKRLKMVEGNSWSFNEGDFSEA